MGEKESVVRNPGLCSDPMPKSPFIVLCYLILLGSPFVNLDGSVGVALGVIVGASSLFKGTVTFVVFGGDGGLIC